MATMAAFLRAQARALRAAGGAANAATARRLVEEALALFPR
jgi:hypothetical protein